VDAPLLSAMSAITDAAAAAGGRPGMGIFLYSDRQETVQSPIPFTRDGPFGSFMGTEGSRLEARWL